MERLGMLRFQTLTCVNCSAFNLSRQGVPWLQPRGGIAAPLLTVDTLAFHNRFLGRRKEDEYMKQVLTAKLKLVTTQEQFAALRATQLAYRDALNAVSRHAFVHGKMSNQRRLQQAMYAEIRALYRLPAQMACNVPRQVGATYKGLWTKIKKNAAMRKAGVTSKRYKGLDEAPKYVSPTLTYNYHRDYSLKPGAQVSILTLAGRVIVSYTGYSEHTALLQQGASIGAAKLWYDQPKKQFYLLVSLEVEVSDPTPDTQTSVVGVDVGIRYLCPRCRI